MNPLTAATQEGVLNAEFNVTFEGETVTVTGEDLQNFDLAGTFTDISTVNNEPVTLLTFPGDQSQYTLPRVPATEAGIDYTLRGVQFETGAAGQGTTTNPVQPGFTQPGNIVITGATPLQSDFQVSNLTPHGCHRHTRVTRSTFRRTSRTMVSPVTRRLSSSALRVRPSRVRKSR
ncbi:MAG: hypothetical protein U5K28_12755 [Halobacteriales archaeon]|nr:hypothetical protein [Halobacteriales archaeon]